MKAQTITFDDLISKVESIIDENMKRGLSRQIFFFLFFIFVMSIIHLY